jgi:hypothetical protein
VVAAGEHVTASAGEKIEAAVGFRRAVEREHVAGARAAGGLS